MPEPGANTWKAIQALALDGEYRADNLLALSILWEGSKKGQPKVPVPEQWESKKQFKEAVSLYGQAAAVQSLLAAKENAKAAKTAFIRRMEAKHRVLYHYWVQRFVDLDPADQLTFDELSVKIDELDFKIAVVEQSVDELLEIAPPGCRFTKATLARRAAEAAAKSGKSGPKPTIAKKKQPSTVAAKKKPAFSLNALLGPAPFAAPVPAPTPAISLAPVEKEDIPAPVYDCLEPEGVEQSYGFAEVWDEVMVSKA